MPFRDGHPYLFFLLLNLPISTVLGWFVAERESVESAQAELEAQTRHAQSRALQAQLTPHALFNALSGLTELVHEDADAAEEALLGLSDLMRRLMRHGGRSAAPLREERELIRAYLTIEQIRLGPRLRIHWDWPEWADTLELPPLLLQPLVENAIKHGIAPHPEGGELKVQALREGAYLVLRVGNTGLPMKARAERTGGLGLGSLRERLRLMRELQGRLLIRSREDWTLVEVRFPASLFE